MLKWIILSIMYLMLSSCGGEVKEEGLEEEKAVMDTNGIYYDSRNTFYKEPFGAVTQGTTINFRIRTGTGKADSVKLVLVKRIILGNNENARNTPFTNLNMQRAFNTNGHDYFEASITVRDIGLYGYWFELENGGYRITAANNNNVVDVPYVDVRGTGGAARLTEASASKVPYLLLVYTNNWKMADWTKDMVIYYIFPDRFKNGSKANDPKVGIRKFYGKKDIEFHTNWNDPFPWVPGPSDGSKTDDSEYCNDFYGGDLDGIIEKLDYLASMGITVIYINPIFKAPSNHKYDTADYMQIDEMFGTIDTFRRLVAQAKKRGIRILLDTSLNHSGSDSIYMDRYGKYPTLGAFENEQFTTNSPYFEWYEWNRKAKNPDQQYSTWANPTLAKLREVDSYKDFAFRRPDSVTKSWMKEGIGGWRMDVTPWKSDQFWREWYAELKKDYPEAFTVAEVWFNASKYFAGDMYDSTMNYIFRSAMLNLGRGGDLRKTAETLEMLRENYPEIVFYRLMNLISSHDLPRALYEIGYRSYSQTNYAEYRSKLMLMMAFQFCFPGAPTVYYGDEVGLTGGADPMNRGPLPWKEDGGNYGDWSLPDDVKRLSAMRRSNQELIYGTVEFVKSEKNLIILSREYKGKKALLLINNGKSPVKLDAALLSGSRKDLFRNKTWDTNESPDLPGLSFLVLGN